MNKAEFITLIENPQKLDKSHVSALKNIAEDFPYFQANHMLLTKALFNENHYEYEKQLRTTALLVSNRELLYRFLHDLHVHEPEVAIPEVEDVVSMPDSKEKIVQQEEVNEVSMIEQTEEQVAEEAFIEELPVPVDSFIEQQVELSVEPVIEEPAVEEIHVEPVTEPVPTEEAIAPKSIAPNEVHSFSEWLLLSKENHLPPVVTDNHEEVKAEETIPEVIGKKEEEMQEIQKEKKPEPTTKSNLNQFESILDKFIRENPSISRPKAEFYKPAHVAKQSVEEDDDLVTETLANIYYQQGAHKKAIRAYEKLCLIYPHKMSYFAALIQKIKEENKND